MFEALRRGVDKTRAGAQSFTGTPTVPTLGQELGGTITLLHGGGHDSYVRLPIVP
jgi:hypothetical protein